jgi:AraC-like DNA-binding protein
MPGSGTGTFIDPDDYQARFNHLRIDLLATSQGTLKANLTWAILHRLQLLHSEEDLPRIAYVVLDPALVFVGFATRPDPPMLWGGVQLQTGDLTFHSRGERFHQRTTGPCSWSLLGLPPEHLERYCEALSGKALSAPAAGRVLRPAARDAARLRRLHAQACRLAETRPKILAHPEVARAIEQGLIHALVTCLGARARDDGDGTARRHHTSIMVRFEEILADHPNRPLHMPELCALIGVTERTLRSCCAEFLGISPTRYMLLRRLRAVRIALRDADPAAASVAEIANGCGFTELGRFAVAYQTAFGESPSTTLRRRPGSGIFEPTSAGSA